MQHTKRLLWTSIALATLILQAPAADAPTTTSTATRQITVGTEIVVSIVVKPAAKVDAWAAEENLPPKFAAKNISQEGAWDQRSSKVKWGPFFDAKVRSLTYTLVPPPGFSGQAALSGLANFDGVDVPVAGQLSGSVKNKK